MRLLVAPAGYGKTTAIREWLEVTDQRAAWYRCDASSTDVAALAAAFAAAAGEFAPGAVERIRKHLQGVSNPASEARALAITLAGSLTEWPSDHLLVIDDYDFVTGSRSAEQFLESVFEDSMIRFVVAARRYPRWASVRRRLYGGIFELNRETLALTKEEAIRLLRPMQPEQALAVWEQAEGWPGVVRLAALTGDSHGSRRVARAALHEYFAEELYVDAPEDVRHALLRLAALPRLRPSAVELALGADADDLCRRAADHGFLSLDSTGRFDLHPLLKTFLESKLRDSEIRSFAQRFIEQAASEKEWDDAYAMIERFSLAAMLPSLLDAAIDALLASHRISTLERWLAFARTSLVEAPILDLAEAELAQRSRELRRGEMHARHAAQGLAEEQSARTSHAYAVAGQCAHLDCRPHDAVKYYRDAQLTALSRSDARAAAWGRFTVAAVWETEEATELLALFDRLSGPDPSSRLRVAAGEMMLATLSGSLEASLRDEEAVLQLVDRVPDPVVTTSILYRLAYIRIACGHYTRGMALAERADTAATAAHLGFASVHIAAARAAAAIGLRQYRKAASLLQRLADMATQGNEPFEQANARALDARLHLCQGLADDAAAILTQWHSTPTPGLRSECAALRALALAIAGEHAESEELASVAASTSTEVQGPTLAALARSVSDIQIHGLIRDRTRELLESVLIERQNWDNVVCTYRAYPNFLMHMAQSSDELRTRIEVLLQEARDSKLANAYGVVSQTKSDLPQLLSRREREVYDLVCRGFTNRGIAEVLVISEATVKVHVRHILDKLGAKTRTEAASRAYAVEAHDDHQALS